MLHSILFSKKRLPLLYRSGARPTLCAGFTLIEILISISILSVLSYASMQTFRRIQFDDALTAGTLRIVDLMRRAENTAQSAQHIEYDLARVYGVHLTKGSVQDATPGSVLFFADKNTKDAVGRWDDTVEFPLGVSDLALATSTPDISGKKELRIERLLVGNQESDSVDIGFQSPNAHALINGATIESTLTVTVRNLKTQRARNIIFNRVSNRIDIVQ